jgi:ATP-binding cassette subfamily B protein
VITYMALLETLRFPTVFSLFTFSVIQQSLASAERILETMTTETEMDEHAGGVSQPIVGEIRFEQVSFGYGDDTSTGGLVLKPLSFTAQPGETIAIVGQTGAGKTTLVRLVNRTFDTTSGRVFVDGIDVRDWSLDSLRSQIATIEQDVILFSRSIADNIAFGARVAVSREQIIEAATLAQAHNFILGFPEGYETIVGERGVTLSGGQRQRIAIARALIVEPQILVLDEPTSALDVTMAQQILRLLQDLQKKMGLSYLLITHDVEVVRAMAHTVIVLKDGEIVESGPLEQVFMQPAAPYTRALLAASE